MPSCKARALIEPVSERKLPDWWAYPVECERRHPWGPGRVIVGWQPCSCDPAREAQPRGPGHLYVSCQERGCTSRWYRPAHGPASVR